VGFSSWLALFGNSSVLFTVYVSLSCCAASDKMTSMAMPCCSSTYRSRGAAGSTVDSRVNSGARVGMLALLDDCACVGMSYGDGAALLDDDISVGMPFGDRAALLDSDGISVTTLLDYCTRVGMPFGDRAALLNDGGVGMSIPCADGAALLDDGVGVGMP